MVSGNMKFGFLTTYESTIFLKLDGSDKDKKVTLWHSNPIPHEIVYQEILAKPKPISAAYHGKVTVRECFLFLASQIAPSTRRIDRHLCRKHCTAAQYIGDWTKSFSANVSKRDLKYISDIPGIPHPRIRGCLNFLSSLHQEKRTSLLKKRIHSMGRKAAIRKANYHVVRGIGISRSRSNSLPRFRPWIKTASY